MKKFFTLIAAAAFMLPMQAQNKLSKTGLVGFATTTDLGLSGTTGGGQGEVVRVKTRAELNKYCTSSQPYVIIIENDITGKGVNDQKDEQNVKSNKTIIGAGAGVSLDGICLNVNGDNNIIIRNVKIANGKPDGMAFRNSHHVWVDHCDLSKCDDGMLDFTVGSSYLTCSWNNTHDHNKSFLANSGTQHFEDRGKCRVTYHHNNYIRTTQRSPRVGYGLGHIFSSYFTENSSYCIGGHTGAKIVAENNYFYNTKQPWNQMYTNDPTWAAYADCLMRDNIYEKTTGNTKGTGVGFDISHYYNYEFAMTKAADVVKLKDSFGMADGILYDLIPYPGHGAIDVMPDATLMVGAFANDSKYSYKIGKAIDALSDYTENFVLEPATTYYWQATVVAPDTTVTSDVFVFTTASEKATIPTPSNNDMKAWLREPVAETKPCAPMTLRWHKAFDASSYKVYISEDANVDEGDYKGESATASFNPTERMKFGQNYYWRVDAVKADGSVVEGDVWHFCSEVKYVDTFGRLELEDMVINGYAFRNNPAGWFPASNNYITMGEAGPGCMSAVWTGKPCKVNVTTTWADEGDGKSWFGLYVNEEQQDSWYADKETNKNGIKVVSRTTSNVTLQTGDEIRLDFYTNSNAQARADCLDIEYVSDITGINDIIATERPADDRIYSLNGQFIGNTLDGLKKGIYIRNGKKFVVK